MDSPASTAAAAAAVAETQAAESVETQTKIKEALHLKLKAGEYSTVFGIPPGQRLADDFSCALLNKMLIQGRLYVFDAYLAFYSWIFGIVTTEVVPLVDIGSFVGAGGCWCLVVGVLLLVSCCWCLVVGVLL